MKRKSTKVEGWIAQYRNLSPAIYENESYLHYVIGINEHEMRVEFDKRPGWSLRKVKIVFEEDEK